MFIQPLSSFTSLGLLCSVVCVTPLTQAAYAQDETAPRVLLEDTSPQTAQTTDEDTDWDEARQTALRLKMALGTCFSDPEKIDPDTKVTIGFKLHDDGRLAGVPKLVGETGATPEEQKLYFHGLSTLHECAPLPINGPGGEFQVVFSPEGVEALHHAANAPVEQEPASEPEASTAFDPATEETETELSLDRVARREIQLRLRLIGFDPAGVDGVFGPKTRSAVSAWQESKGFPATGYLNSVQLSELQTQSQEPYANYEPPPARAAPALQRVRVCRRTGFLGIMICRYEYR